MSWYRHHRYFYLAVDPIHVGAGGYRLGRVDNSIVREPGTNLPKVPGTSLSGAARSYAAMTYGRPDAAGTQAGLDGKPGKEKKHSECPILYTFGTASDDVKGGDGGSKAGAVSLSDAQILFFPVSTTEGPMWVSSREVLAGAGFRISGVSGDSDKAVLTRTVSLDRVNAGWLMFEIGGTAEFTAVPEPLAKCDLWREIKDKVMLLSPRFFGVVVNSNLEVRTSVSIDPATGAAQDGHLFTYEAIPRAAWLYGDVIVDDYVNKFPTRAERFGGQGKIPGGEWKRPDDVVDAGLGLIEYLGVGGMGTRGFGRLKIVGNQELAAVRERGSAA